MPDNCPQCGRVKAARGAPWDSCPSPDGPSCRAYAAKRKADGLSPQMGGRLDRGDSDTIQFPNGPSPQQVAEAVVEPDDALKGYSVKAGDFWIGEHGEWSKYPLVTRLESTIRAALDKAMEAAGVYARPPGATCECVRLTGDGENVPDCLLLDDGSRKRAWIYDPYCDQCYRGVPKAAPAVQQPTAALDPAKAPRTMEYRPAAPAVTPGGEELPDPFPCPECGRCDPEPGTVTIPAAELAGLRRDHEAMEVLRKAVADGHNWIAWAEQEPGVNGSIDPADALLAKEEGRAGPRKEGVKP